MTAGLHRNAPDTVEGRRRRDAGPSAHGDLAAPSTRPESRPSLAEVSENDVDHPGEVVAVGLHRDGMLVERYRYPPGPPVELPRHVHEQYQINLNLGAPGGVHHRGSFHAIAPGMLSVIMPGEPHRSRDPDDRTSVSEHLTCYPTPQTLTNISSDLGLHHLPSFELIVADMSLSTRFASVLKVIREPDRLYTDVSLLELFAELITRHSSGGAPTGKVPDAQPAVTRARDYLHDHAADNVAIADLSIITGLSPYWLIRQFTEQVGVAPHRYQLQLRIERAKQLLIAGSRPNETAQAVGFYDLSHFTRHFKRQVGVSPGRYVREVARKDFSGSRVH